MDANPNEQKGVLAVRTVSISNDLYGNDLLSSFGLAKGCTKSNNNEMVKAIPEDIVDAQLKPSARKSSP